MFFHLIVVTNVLVVKPKASKNQSFLKSGFKNNEKLSICA